MKSLKRILAASALAVAGCGSGDEDDEAAEGPLAPLFFWAYLLGGGSRALDDPGPVAALEGSAPEAVVELRWFNETTGASGVAEGTTSWTARVPVVSGVNVVTVTAWDVAGRLDSTTGRVLYDGSAVSWAP